MLKNRHALPFVILCLAATHRAQAQPGYGAFSSAGRGAATTFATDYQAIGVNPANLGWKWRYANKHVALGLLEGSYGVYSDALTRTDIRQRMLNSDYRFTEAEKNEAVRNFTGAGATAQVDLMALGLCYANENAGGFAFQVRDRVQVGARFGPRMSQLAFKGSSADVFDLLVLATGDTVANYAGMSPDSLAMVVLGIATQPQLIGQVVQGSRIGITWYREFNFSYGRHLLRRDGLELDLGVGLKYLMGIGVVDIAADGGRLDGFSALSPDFQIDYATGEFREGARFAPGTLANPRPVGRGFGLDLGLAAVINDAWKAGVAVTDLGAMRWTGNVYAANDGNLVELASAGLENYDLINGLEDFVTNSGILQWERGGAERRPLASTVRLGLGRLFGEHVELGADAVLPLNQATGSISGPVWALGADLRPVRWVQFSTGLMGGGGQALKVPVGLCFIAGNGTWELGFASRDAVTFFTRRNPTLSLGLGFLRFRF